MTDHNITIDVVNSLTQVDPAEWDACANPEGGQIAQNPFVTHRFLLALELSGSIGPGTGWEPHYLLARDGDRLIGTAPLYAKSHSQGEYIFDHSWAHAYENAGGNYYPKLQIAVPFTPVTGRRFLTRPGHDAVAMNALVQAAVQIGSQNGLSSLHITFCSEDEALAGRQMGLMHRSSQQFHWLNQGYQSFDDFLGALSSRKRKAIRKERRIANAFGGQIRMLTGDDLRPEHWDAFWQFYQDTGARKWGTPYLTRGFFDHVQNTMRDDVLLVLAKRDGIPVAGALNFIGAQTLYGRYWGCIEDHAYLHFEACYYRAIDFAIERGLTGIEAGAQGDHKLARGYMPVTTHSLHWVNDQGFAQAIAKFIEAEQAAVAQDVEVLTAYGPFRKTQVEEQQ